MRTPCTIFIICMAALTILAGSSHARGSRRGGQENSTISQESKKQKKSETSEKDRKEAPEAESETIKKARVERMIREAGDGSNLTSFSVKTENGSLYGYKDRKTEKTVLPAKYDMADEFSEGLAYIQYPKKDGIIGVGGYIDAKGRMVIPYNQKDFKIWYEDPFKEGLAPVGYVPAPRTSRVGFIDTAGKLVLENSEWKRAKPFGDGLAPVHNRNKLWGYIDRTGKYVIHPEFYDAQPFFNGIAVIETAKDEFYLITKSGDRILTVDSNTFWTQPLSGFVQVKVNGKYQTFDTIKKKIAKTLIPEQQTARALWKKGEKAGKAGFEDAALEHFKKAIQCYPKIVCDYDINSHYGLTFVRNGISPKSTVRLEIVRNRERKTVSVETQPCSSNIKGWKSRPAYKLACDVLFNSGLLACYAGHPALAERAALKLEILFSKDPLNKKEEIKAYDQSKVLLLRALSAASAGNIESAYKMLAGADKFTFAGFNCGKYFGTTFKSLRRKIKDNRQCTWVVAPLFTDRNKLAFILNVDVKDLPRVKASYPAPQPFPNLDGKIVKPPQGAPTLEIGNEKKTEKPEAVKTKQEPEPKTTVLE